VLGLAVPSGGRPLPASPCPLPSGSLNSFVTVYVNCKIVFMCKDFTVHNKIANRHFYNEQT
jgi:hypothetical protein